MAFSPPEYCWLFAQKKAYQGGVTDTAGPPPPSYAPAVKGGGREGGEGETAYENTH